MMKVREIDKKCVGDVIAGIRSPTCFILWRPEFQSTGQLKHLVRDESPQTIEPR
jgi:hypothetical protein